MHGGLLIDKPEGWTSHDVVARVRRLAGTRRVGHTGTLDPFATGLLLVCVGAATRLTQFLVGCEKEYLATIRLGWATNTQDRTGELTGRVAASEEIPDDAAQIRSVLAERSGEQDQLPPMFSAKKVGGQTLHKLARAGKDVARATVRINASLELMGPEAGRLERNADGTVDVSVRVSCSAGTYVRTLAHDLGTALGCGAHLEALRRTRVGYFTIDDATRLEDLEGRVAEKLIAPERLVDDLPSMRLTDQEMKRFVNGGAISLGERDLMGELCSAVDEDGHLIAIGRVDRATGVVRPYVVLAVLYSA